ncbi:putative MscS family protein YkuT [bacterium HR29]|nr:putative MscS family protein YkuT [bacterium HR29]
MSPFLFDPTKLSDWRGLFANEEGQLTEAAERLLTIIGIVAGLVILDLVVRWFIRRAKNRVVARMVAARPAEAVAIRGRLDTIAATVNWGISIFLVFLGAGLVLGALGLDVTTLVAGVGVVGVALGLGAQMLVRDVINGLFILLENQYQVGDVVQVAGVSGQVIEINPRRTVLRDLDGNVHSVPNSAITVATNMTPGTSRINLNISVAYEEDVDRAIRIINEECARLAEERRADIIEAPRVLRVDDLGESGVVIKVLGDVRSFTQWELAGELRRRIKKRFDAEGIEIPYPHRMVIHKHVAGRTDERPPDAVPPEQDGES